VYLLKNIAIISLSIGWSLQAFGMSFPFALYIPYVPWEWVAGIYILAKILSGKTLPEGVK
jgi:hypothetical protein